MKLTQSKPKLAEFNDSLISIREALEVLGGKWKIPIMVSLAGGSKRFSEIKCEITGITSKVLSRKLKELEGNNLVLRSVNKETDVAMYAVTNKCKSLEKIIEGLKEWGDYHRSDIFQRDICTRPIIHFPRQAKRQGITIE